MPVDQEPITEPSRNTLRLIASPRDNGEVRNRNVVTMEGVPSLKPDKRGQGAYGGYKETVVMPEATPDESWREDVLSMAHPRNPMVPTPRDEDAWRKELLARPRPRNPLFEGD